jgi:hypothetical protein
MTEPASGHEPAAITIASPIHRADRILIVLCVGAIAVMAPFVREEWPRWARRIPTPVPVVAAYITVAVFASLWLSYRVCRLGVRFDDHGVTIRKEFQTYRYSWPEVSRFVDGYAESGGGRFWALDIVLSDGQAVTVRAPVGSANARPKTLAAIGQVAARYQIPAELTGTPPGRN